MKNVQSQLGLLGVGSFRRRTARGFPVLTVIIVILLSASASSANVSDWELTSSASPTSDAIAQSASADCPAGKQLIGGGAALRGETLGPAITTTGPNGPSAAPTGWFAVAYRIPNLQGLGMLWSIEAFAICGNIENYQVVTESTASDSTSPKALTVDCPDGTQVLSGGGRLFGPISHLALAASRPDGLDPASPDGWYGEALEWSPSADTWGLRVDVVCGTISDYEVVTSSVVFGNAVGFTSAFGSPGLQLIGIGGQVLSNNVPHPFLTAIYPLPSGTDPAHGALVAANEILQSGGTWTIRADAIYAPEPSFSTSLLMCVVVLLAARSRDSR